MRFADEEAPRRYLAESRWPDGFRCPVGGTLSARTRAIVSFRTDAGLDRSGEAGEDTQKKPKETHGS